MSKLFLFSLSQSLGHISLGFLVVIFNATIILISALCTILSLVKSDYNIKNRLWIVFFMVGISLIQLWVELLLNSKVQHLFLTIGVSVCLLSLILFLPSKSSKITEPQRDLARLISDSIKREHSNNFDNHSTKEREVFCSPIIKAEPRQKTVSENKEIEFSHVKTVLSKLEYYPLKEQDKKQAQELENAIFLAEQNGLNPQLKSKINDGLGALLKIMSKYAV